MWRVRDVLPFVQFEKRENTYGGLPLLEAFNFTKINTPPWVFFHGFELYKSHKTSKISTLAVSYFMQKSVVRKLTGHWQHCSQLLGQKLLFAKHTWKHSIIFAFW